MNDPRFRQTNWNCSNQTNKTNQPERVGKVRFAYGHDLGVDSVDGSTEPPEIRWEYRDIPLFMAGVKHAIGQWGSSGGVVFATDAWFTYEDLDIWDVYNAGCLFWYGWFDHDIGTADEILFNVENIRGDLDHPNPECRSEPALPQAVAVHELGHAMGFGENDGVPDLAGQFSVMLEPNPDVLPSTCTIGTI